MNGGAGGSERPEERQRFPPPGSSRLWGRTGSCRRWCRERSRPRVMRSVRSCSERGRNGRLWKRSGQGSGGHRRWPQPPSPSGRRCSSSGRRRSSGSAGYGQGPAPGGALRKLRAPRRRQGLAALLRFLFGPPRLQPQLRGEQELALAMAQCALDDNESVHMRILQTIYKKLTRSRLGCPRYGAHWEELGFQGTDPGTDLRGTGMLALMQLLFFVMDPQMLPLALDIFRLSQHETQEFPFGIMSVNITRIVLQALREERLSRECNRRQQVIAVLNDLYAAAFLRLYRTWKGQHKTIADSCFLLKELELSTKRKPKQLLKSLEAFVSRGPTAEGPAPPSPPSPSSRELSFTGLCDLEGELRLV
ncbi:ELMO domain-containing protein 3 isoform 1-T1 [Amazona ochrocephala]